MIGRTPLFAQVSASYALRPARDAIGVQWAWLGAGLGGLVSWQALGLDLRLHTEVIAEYIRARGSDPDTGRGDAGSRWTPGLRAGFQAVWPTQSPIALVVGADAWTLTQSTVIHSRGERIGSSPSSNFVFLVGGEIPLP